MSMERGLHTQASSATLVDLLDRVLDKGLVVAGDISISLANVELLTIRIRLLVCSIDKAEEIGLNWWRYESRLTGNGSSDEVARLQARVAELEQQLKAVSAASKGGVSRGSR
jgi:hypothetical protein